MKKLNLNIYESPLPPENTSVLWADKEEKTGEIKVIYKFIKGEWEPFLVSVDYMKPDEE